MNLQGHLKVNQVMRLEGGYRGRMVVGGGGEGVLLVIAITKRILLLYDTRGSKSPDFPGDLLILTMFHKSP